MNSAPEPSDPAEEEPAAPEPGDVLEVFIKGRVYSVADGTSGETTAVSLERVIELAKAVPGDGNGIRVKVSRDPTSRTTAEIALRDKLIAAGISKEAIAGLDEAVD